MSFELLLSFLFFVSWLCIDDQVAVTCLQCLQVIFEPSRLDKILTLVVMVFFDALSYMGIVDFGHFSSNGHEFRNVFLNLLNNWRN